MTKNVRAVKWYTGMNGPVGIVAVERQDGTMAAYIGMAPGLDPETDMQHIADWGGRFDCVAACAALFPEFPWVEQKGESAA